MLTSSQLTLAANALDANADARGISPANGIDPARRAASDARAEAAAAGGYSSTADMALHIVIDSDRAMVEHLIDVTRRVLTGRDIAYALADVTDYPDLSAEQQTRNLHCSYVANALSDELRSTLRERVVERAMIRHHWGDESAQQAEQRDRAAVEMVSAMAAYALDQVDWIALAGEYVDRVLGLGEHASAAVSA